MDKLRVLIVDDDQAVGTVLAGLLTQAGYVAVRAASARGAMAVLNAQVIDLMITDLRMPEADGFVLLCQARQAWPELPVVMLTAHGNVPLAVQAMREGASDFLLKPFEREAVVSTVRRVLASHAARRTAPPRPSLPSAQLLGSSSEIEALRERIRRAAASQTAVLISGESGSGKKLVANLLHQDSARRQAPLVLAELRALPAEMVEAELFGETCGAGAALQRPGRVALAHGGTLFLDEVGALSAGAQGKLLRLIQEGTFEGLGGPRAQRADVRVVAATQYDLSQWVAQGRFRADLFYSLNVVSIALPPLRGRQRDLHVMTEHFCASFTRQHQKKPPRLSPEAWRELERHDWPGNVRELASLIERLVVLHAGETLDAARVREELAQGNPRVSEPASRAEQVTLALDARVREAEREALAQALRKAGGNRSLAARILGVSRRTLYNKLSEHDLAERGPDTP